MNIENPIQKQAKQQMFPIQIFYCLLYTSDAADD